MKIEYEGVTYDSDKGEFDVELLNAYKEHPEPLSESDVTDLITSTVDSADSIEMVERYKEAQNELYNSIEYLYWFDNLSPLDKYIESNNRQIRNTVFETLYVSMGK